MNKADTAELLAFAAAFDQRTIGNADVEAWTLVLADTPWDDTTREAIALYYRTAPQNPEERRFLQVHHVRTYRSRVRQRRFDHVREPVPNTVEGVHYCDELRAVRTAIADGRIKDQADADAYERWGGSLHLANQRGELPRMHGAPALTMRARPVTETIKGAFQSVPGADGDDDD